jgi:hypothetical protein
LTDRSITGVSPFIVGASGHRDLHPGALQHLRNAVATILRQLKEYLPDSELRIMAGMAAGADLLVVQTALELGFSVDALLPMPLAHYAADFDTESFALLKRLLADPKIRRCELGGGVPRIEANLPVGSALRDAHYATLTRNLTRGCSLLIALWDGESSLLPGGTADTVLRYLGVRTDRNKNDERIQFSDAPPQRDLPGRLVYWIPAARARPGAGPIAAAPCFLSGRGDNSLQQLRMVPQTLKGHLRALDTHNREHELPSSRITIDPPA